MVRDVSGARSARDHTVVKEPKVSVLLPTFNGEAVVERAIHSVLSQSFTDWELIILDDASTDSTREICARSAESDPRVRLIPGETNVGLAAAMNRLVGHARGDLLAVQEQDDRSVRERLELQVEYLDRHPDVGMVSGIARWMDGENELALFPGRLAQGSPYPAAMVEYLLIEQCKVVNACVMFRRRCLPSNHPPFDEEARMSIDWQFFVDVAHRDRIAGIPEVLVEMDRSPTRSSVTSDGALREREARRLLRIVRQRYLHDPSSPVTWRVLRRAWATEINLEGRSRGGTVGLGFVAVALMTDPRSAAIRASARDMLRRAIRRVRNAGSTGQPLSEAG